MPARNAFYAQSGGVTSVINTSACGVIETARKYKNKITKIIESKNWREIRSALVLQKPFVAADTINALQEVDLEEAKQLDNCLVIWQNFYGLNLPRMINENVEQGADKRKMYEDDLDLLIKRFDENVLLLEDSKE